MVLILSRVAQRKRAGPITQRSMDRNHPLLSSLVFPNFVSYLEQLPEWYAGVPDKNGKQKSRVAQWKRAGPITQRSVDRNYPLLATFSCKKVIIPF